MKIPPAMLAPQGSPADQATQDLIEACRPLGTYLVSLPDTSTRAAAVQHFNEALMWAHQTILRAMPSASRVIVAGADALPPKP